MGKFLTKELIFQLCVAKIPFCAIGVAHYGIRLPFWRIYLYNFIPMDTNTNTPIDNPPSVWNRFLKSVSAFLKRNFLTVCLVLAIVGVYLWGNYKVNRLEREYAANTGKLVTMDKIRVDSLSLANAQLTTKVFGWAVRSELLRGNVENAELFLNGLIKEQNIEQIDLIDPNTQKIIKSTNKKDEGTAITNPAVLGTDKQITQSHDNLGYTIINPVMGLDSKIGILVVRIKK